MKTATSLMIASATMLALCPVWAQDTATPSGPETSASAPNEVTIGQTGSEQDPLSGREPVILVEPSRATPRAIEGLDALPALRIKLDPRVLGIAPGDPLPRLRREGEALRRRDGRLLPPGEHGFAVFIADADPEAGDDAPVAMVIAPCMTLESMERLQEDRGENLRFTMTGEVHTYRGVNYLLPTAQPKPWLVADGGPQTQETADASTDQPTKPQPVETTEQQPQPDAVSDDGSQSPVDDEPMSADQVLQDLLKQRDKTPSTDPPGSEQAGTSSDAGGPPVLPSSAGDGPGLLADPLLIGLDTDQPQAEIKPEGQLLIARTGRHIRSTNGTQALFVLDSDQRDAPEPPLIIQACKLLETMEDTVMEQGETVPFVVTGQVYVYRGANYLLPTIVRREFDRGNLE